MIEQKNITHSKIEGLFVINRPTYSDNRGFFREALRLNELANEIYNNFNPVQMNHAYSLPSVIRGIHAENWNKIVYPITGKVFLAMVDIRSDSPTFKKVEIFDYDTNKDRLAFFLPKGVANSVCVKGRESVHYIYLVDAYYDGSDTTAIAWDDPELAIPWPIENPIISERDRHNPTLQQWLDSRK
jgi:dTDP-4-dehydrorhamnose 3,5-epimerase